MDGSTQLSSMATTGFQCCICSSLDCIGYRISSRLVGRIWCGSCAIVCAVRRTARTRSKSTVADYFIFDRKGCTCLILDHPCSDFDFVASANGTQSHDHVFCHESLRLPTGSIDALSPLSTPTQYPRPRFRTRRARRPRSLRDSLGPKSVAQHGYCDAHYFVVEYQSSAVVV